MRAMLLENSLPVEQKPLLLRDLQVPSPGPGEIRVKVRACGLCHTDLHIVEGDLALQKRPVIPGHQIVGIVDALGSGITQFKEGDRIGIPWLHSTDGNCHYCQQDQENLCDHAAFTGYDVDGGYAEYALARADFSFPLPKTFSDEAAAPLLCAGIIGFRSFRLSGARRGDCLGIYGFGGSAHLVLQFARYLGCKVHVITRSAAHRELATELGACWVGSAEQASLAALDAAIIFAPAGPLVPQALRSLRKGGTLALAGITMTEIPALDYSLLYQERIIRSVTNNTRRDAREFLELASDAKLQTEIDIYPLERANEALADLKHSRLRAAGVLRL
jgi:propanol-preferring alcohol dehydrogenase